MQGSVRPDEKYIPEPVPEAVPVRRAFPVRRLQRSEGCCISAPNGSGTAVLRLPKNRFFCGKEYLIDGQQ